MSSELEFTFKIARNYLKSITVKGLVISANEMSQHIKRDNSIDINPSTLGKALFKFKKELEKDNIYFITKPVNGNLKYHFSNIMPEEASHNPFSIADNFKLCNLVIAEYTSSGKTDTEFAEYASDVMGKVVSSSQISIRRREFDIRASFKRIQSKPTSKLKDIESRLETLEMRLNTLLEKLGESSKSTSG